LLFFIIPAALQATYLAPLITVTHSLVKPSMRAVSSAVVLLMVNLIGLGFGPVLVGGLSDYLEPTYGNESLRYSLLFWVSAATIACLVLCALTAKHIRKDMPEQAD
jgi:MFS family permease